MATAQRKVILFSGPSGSGKTTIIRFLLREMSQLVFSISATTRTCRVGELEGKDYYFIMEATFQKHIKDGRFLEWERVYENAYYGTYLEEIERIQGMECVPILDLDVQGGLNTKQIYGQSCLALFVYVPRIGELKNRLLLRGMPDDEKLKERLDKSSLELKHKKSFDCVIDNTAIDKACKLAYQHVSHFLSN